MQKNGNRMNEREKERARDEKNRESGGGDERNGDQGADGGDYNYSTMVYSLRSPRVYSRYL